MVGTGKAAEHGHPDPRRRGAGERARASTRSCSTRPARSRAASRGHRRRRRRRAGRADELLRLAAAAERGSEHPLGEAIVERAPKLGLDAAGRRASSSSLPGAGSARDGRWARGPARQRGAAGRGSGDRRRSRRNPRSCGPTPGDADVRGGRRRGRRAHRRRRHGQAESAEAIAQLEALGLDVWMLTGDTAATAAAIAAQVGIDHVLAEVLPGEKAAQIAALQAQGKVVAMVGDGDQRRPGAGPGRPRHRDRHRHRRGDGGLRHHPGRRRPARRGHRDRALAAHDREIKQNLFWAFAYNVVLIPVAMGALYPFSGSC